MSFANFTCELRGCHCVPPKSRETGRKETEEENYDRGGNSNGINDNCTDQNNEDHTEQSNEDGTLSL